MLIIIKINLKYIYIDSISSFPSQSGNLKILGVKIYVKNSFRTKIIIGKSNNNNNNLHIITIFYVPTYTTPKKCLYMSYDIK